MFYWLLATMFVLGCCIFVLLGFALAGGYCFVGLVAGCLFSYLFVL